MSKVARAKVLAFEGKLVNSDGLMYSGKWQDRGKSDSWIPVEVNPKTVRGTISHDLKNFKEIDSDVKKPNPQTVDHASLPHDADTLKVCFTLRVLGNLTTPSACSEPEYHEQLISKVDKYINEYAFAELAKRYATNLVTGRFLWRNRVEAEQLEIVVKHQSQTWTFDGYEYPLHTFDKTTKELEAVANVIQQGLNGDEFTFLEVTAYSKLGRGQTVYPSQEMVLDKTQNAKSKILYTLDGGAAMHSQKIGNALRTIDTWHPQVAQAGAISVEPYGSVTSRGDAYRHPTRTKLDFYTLLDNWVSKDQELEAEQQHYLIANLIRGGVFGKAS